MLLYLPALKRRGFTEIPMIYPVLTLEQSLQLSTMKSALERAAKSEIIDAYLYLYEQYMLADNYRKVAASKLLLGVDTSDKYLAKFQKNPEQSRIQSHLDEMKRIDEEGQ